MVIRVHLVSSAADTATQGQIVHGHIMKALQRDDIAIVSFKDVDTATSSFVNAAFVPLLRSFSFNEIKRRVRIIDSTRQINDMIKRRLTREA